MRQGDGIRWVKSSYSDTGANCVEVAAPATPERLVRDSKRGHSGPVLAFPASAWDAFLGKVTEGR